MSTKTVHDTWLDARERQREGWSVDQTNTRIANLAADNGLAGSWPPLRTTASDNRRKQVFSTGEAIEWDGRQWNYLAAPDDPA
jgi:hypothetical protein